VGAAVEYHVQRSDARSGKTSSEILENSSIHYYDIDVTTSCWLAISLRLVTWSNRYTVVQSNSNIRGNVTRESGGAREL
jgi:hypothetical protein